MRKLTTIVLILFSLGMTDSYGQLTNGLIAHWPCNGNANDSTGTGHNGVMHNVATVAGKSGIAGTALQFAGDTSSYISVPFASDFNVTNFSLCAVVKLAAFNTDVCQSSNIMTRGSGGTHHYKLAFCDNAYDSSCTAYDTNYYVVDAWAGTNNNNTYSKEWQVIPTIRTNTWYTLVSTFNGSSIKVYINGALIKTINPHPATAMGSNSEGISIGKWSFGSQPFLFKGIIDDLRLYNRALTDAEVLSYYQLDVKNAIERNASIYPNPFSEQLVVSDIKGVTICLYNLTGTQVYSGHANTSKEYINTSIFPKGIYLLQLTDGEGNRIFRKIVKE